MSTSLFCRKLAQAACPLLQEQCPRNALRRSWRRPMLQGPTQELATRAHVHTVSSPSLTVRLRVTHSRVGLWHRSQCGCCGSVQFLCVGFRLCFASTSHVKTRDVSETALLIHCHAVQVFLLHLSWRLFHIHVYVAVCLVLLVWCVCLRVELFEVWLCCLCMLVHLLLMVLLLIAACRLRSARAHVVDDSCAVSIDAFSPIVCSRLEITSLGKARFKQRSRFCQSVRPHQGMLLQWPTFMSVAWRTRRNSEDGFRVLFCPWR